jgi:alkanesulfonate monooxygenase SsuD/methylene tetrahydromethanopterin reductase-like flavin-dependent oxidoreductase (luciferase family)
MRFGLFGGAQARRGDGDPARGFRDYVDMCVEAEALGFDSSFLAEHHFSDLGQVSASLDLLAWVAARTTAMRLGTAVIALPWHNPVLLAERTATLDLMSGGRLEFGVGKGYRHSEFAGFCIPYEEAQARFEEALQVIIKAWTSNNDDVFVLPEFDPQRRRARRAAARSTLWTSRLRAISTLPATLSIGRRRWRG